MIIDEKEILIIQYNLKKNEWEDITRQVQWFDAQYQACRIKYFGNNTFYWKSWRELKIINKDKSVDLKIKLFIVIKFLLAI